MKVIESRICNTWPGRKGWSSSGEVPECRFLVKRRKEETFEHKEPGQNIGQTGLQHRWVPDIPDNKEGIIPYHIRMTFCTQIDVSKRIRFFCYNLSVTRGNMRRRSRSTEMLPGCRAVVGEVAAALAINRVLLGSNCRAV